MEAATSALAIALPVGWYLLSPLFIDRVVEEKLPAVASDTCWPRWLGLSSSCWPPG